jgi:hypothetical protein
MANNVTHIESELKNKIFYLHKALHECSEIVDTLKTENRLLKEDCEKIYSHESLFEDLSKIRGNTSA